MIRSRRAAARFVLAALFGLGSCRSIDRPDERGDQPLGEPGDGEPVEVGLGDGVTTANGVGDGSTSTRGGRSDTTAPTATIVIAMIVSAGR